MFNLDELVKNEELQIAGEILHIKPITKGFADRYRNQLTSIDKKVKAKKITMADIGEIHKMIVEYLSNNIENKKFSVKDLDDYPQEYTDRLITHIGEVITKTEKK